MQRCHARPWRVPTWDCGAVDGPFVFCCEICDDTDRDPRKGWIEQTMLIARTFAEISSDNPWQRAYWVTIALTALLTGAALLIWGFGIESHWANGCVAAGVCLVGMYCGIRMILAGGLLGALPYFLIGSAIFYGAGTVLAAMNPAAMALLSFTDDVQKTMLAKVNLANALSMLLIVAAAGPLCAGLRPAPRNQPGVQGMIKSLEEWLPGLLIASFAVTFLIWFTFPVPQDFILGTLVRFLRGLPLFTILLGAALWDRQTGTTKAMVILLLLAHVLFGMLSFVKLLTLLPVLVLVLGWWLNGTLVRTALIVTTAVMVLYFAAFAELVAIGRLHTNYDPVLNSVLERVGMLIDSVDMFIEFRKNDIQANVELRFATAPYQAYFMALYDTGFPGDSMEQAKTILIPRVFWPEKPILNPGSEFDLIFRGSVSDSSLAIGFIAEGYWNHGWLGVVIVSGVVGAQLGWFTRKWFLFTEHGPWHIGIFLFAPLVVYSAAWAEVNFVGGYVGGTARMILLIMMIDVIARIVISHRESQLRI
ncbi:MAG: hypothetical protein AB8B85_09250 [Paracoccaceae bacterium]